MDRPFNTAAFTTPPLGTYGDSPRNFLIGPGSDQLNGTLIRDIKLGGVRNVTLQINALFRRVSENTEWGSGFLTVAGSQGLAPGATSDPITIKSQLGYTGSEQSRMEMLQNTHFVDAKVELFGKYASTQWVRLGSYPITRQLLTK